MNNNCNNISSMNNNSNKKKNICDPGEYEQCSKSIYITLLKQKQITMFNNRGCIQSPTRIIKRPKKKCNQLEIKSSSSG